MNGYKRFPFEWRDAVMKLDGLDLKVWLYHYWRSDKHNSVSIADPELVRKLGNSRTRISEAKSRLVAQGLLTKTGSRDTGGKFMVPIFTVSARCSDGTVSTNCDTTEPQNADTAKCGEYVLGSLSPSKNDGAVVEGWVEGGAPKPYKLIPEDV